MSYLFFKGKKNRFYLFLVTSSILLACVAFTGSVQEIEIHGRVVDEKNQPVSFATISVNSSKVSVAADLKGFFRIKVKKLPVILVFSAIGFESKTHTWKEEDGKNKKSFLVRLKAASAELKEVVVTAYDAERGKRDMAYSSKKVSAAHLARVPGVTVSGEEAGVYVREDRITMPKEGPKKKPEISVGGAAVKSTSYHKSKLLTAGEVNDFRKWKLWEDYNEHEFKTYAAQWGLFASNRYSVQLQNPDYKPLSGVSVSLVNKASGHTLWTAMTDNTGKAELWTNFGGSDENNELEIVVDNDPKSFSAIPFTQGINRFTKKKSCTLSNKVEIAFVVDATGSMGDEIEYLKEELADILSKVKAKDSSLDLFTGSVFYRDHGDEYVTKLQPITKGVDKTVDFIQKQSADGGGDYPEALNDALQEATNKLSWSKDARARIMFLLMDAPPHQREKDRLSQLIRDAATKGIRIVPVACSGTDKATEFIMRSMALATNGTYLFLTDDSGIGNAHIKPTTDEFKVELLNDLMQRTIEQMCFANDCASTTTSPPLANFSNPEKVKLYPNPSRGPVTLETSSQLKEIFLADFTGKILFRQVVQNKSGRVQMNLSGYPSATYFVKYITMEGKTGAEKLLLAR